MGNHVFTYEKPHAHTPKVDKPYYVKARVQTLMEVDDRYLYTDAQ